MQARWCGDRHTLLSNRRSLCGVATHGGLSNQRWPARLELSADTGMSSSMPAPLAVPPAAATARLLRKCVRRTVTTVAALEDGSDTPSPAPPAKLLVLSAWQPEKIVPLTSS